MAKRKYITITGPEEGSSSTDTRPRGGLRLTSSVGIGYRLIDHLGSGASSDTWRAEDDSRKAWAVKIFRTRPDGPVTTEEGVRRAYEREREMLVRIRGLECPHLIRVESAFVDDGTTHCCIVMDLAENGSLERYITSPPGSAYSLDEVLKWAKHLALALDALSRAPPPGSSRIVHGDVSLRNLLLTAGRDLVLADFGISMLRTRAQLNLAPTFQPDGPHVAPEVRLSPNDPRLIDLLHENIGDHKMDMWSYGYCLFLLALRKAATSNNITTRDIDALAARHDLEPYLQQEMAAAWGQPPDDHRVMVLGKLMAGALNPSPSTRLSAEEALRLLTTAGGLFRDLLPSLRSDLILRQGPLDQLKAAVLLAPHHHYATTTMSSGGGGGGSVAAAAATAAGPPVRSASGVVLAWGMAGVGKSTMVRQLLDDQEVRARFPAGVVWLVLGHGSGLNLLEKQSLLYLHMLGQPPTPSFQSLEHGRFTLLRALQDRACLVVLDDVWDQAHADALDVLGPGGMLLITSRSEAIMRGRARLVKLRCLDDPCGDLAKQMLACYAGLLPASSSAIVAAAPAPLLPAAAMSVLEVCKGLPLAIAVVGSLMRELEGVTWEEVLEHVRSSGNSMGLLEGQPHGGLSSYPGLCSALEASVSRLHGVNAQAAGCLKYYGAWAEDTRMSIGLAGRIWGLDRLSTRKVLKCLSSWSLVEVNEQQESGVHDLLRDFLRSRAPGPELAELHATTLIRGCGQRKVLALHGPKAELSSSWEPAERCINDSFWYHVDGMGPRSAMAAQTLKQVLQPVEQLHLKRHEGSEAGIQTPMGALLSCVGSSPVLRNLDLRDFHLPLSCMSALGASMSQPGACPRLECIFLSNMRLSASKAAALGQALQLPDALPQLRRLVILSDGMGPHVLEALIPTGAESSWGLRLRELILEDMQVGDVGAQCVARLVAAGGLPMLERLCLSMNGMGDEGCRALCHALGSSRAGERIRSLELALNDFGDGGFAALAAAVPAVPRLENLTSHGNPVTATGLRLLCDALSQPTAAPVLTQLSIWPRACRTDESEAMQSRLVALVSHRRHSSQPESLAAELRAFEEDAGASELRIRGCADGALLVESLLTSRCFMSSIGSRLRYLCLPYCDLGDAGLRRLMQALIRQATTCAIEVLYLEGNRLGADAAVAIAEWLVHPVCSRRLRNLDLSDNPLGDGGAEALAGALSSGAGADDGGAACASLQNLLLHFTALSDGGAALILAALASPGRFEALRWVDLRYNDLGAASLQACETLVLGKPLVCPSLNLLLLQGNPLGTDALAELDAACRQAGVRTRWETAQ